MRLSALTFHRQYLRFEQQVQEHSSGEPFLSFQEGLPEEWEGYKEGVRNEALRRMRFRKWKRADIGTGRILGPVIKAIEIKNSQRAPRNNLVAWENRRRHNALSHRKLLDARSDAIARRSFEQLLIDFYQSRVAEAEAFEGFRRLVGNRYDIIAYLFFLKDVARFMPIAPTTFDKAFELLGIKLVTARQCSWENYVSYNEALVEVQRALRDVAGVAESRLLDAHSFCWMLVRLGLPKAPPAVLIPLPETVATLPAVIAPLDVVSGETEFDVVNEEQFAKREAERRRLGKLAQEIALQSERRRLREAGHPNPEDVVTPVWDEPARGYDILSCEHGGPPRYIEVKAARLFGQTLSFFLTQNEWKQSRLLPNYHLYLVLNAQSKNPTVRVISSGDVHPSCLAPINYVASLSVLPR